MSDMSGATTCVPWSFGMHALASIACAVSRHNVTVLLASKLCNSTYVANGSGFVHSLHAVHDAHAAWLR